MVRISSIGYEKRKYGLNTAPISEKCMGQPAPLCCNHVGINTLQEEFCGITYAKGMTWHLGKTSCDPHSITAVHEPRLGHGCPATINCLIGEEGCRTGNKSIGGEVMSEGQERASRVIASCDRNVSACFSCGLSPWNMEGGMFCTIRETRELDREDAMRNMF
jgi:hypothetical protein